MSLRLLAFVLSVVGLADVAPREEVPTMVRCHRRMDYLRQRPNPHR